MTAKRSASKIKRPKLLIDDIEEQPKQKIWGWAALFVFSTILLLVTAYIAHKHTLIGVELSVFRHINNLPDSLRPLFLIATIAPESLWIGVASVVVTFALKMYQAAWQLSAAIFGGYFVAALGKHFIGRYRPEGMISDVHVRAQETGMGFPSGHTMVVTVIVLTLWPYMPRGWRWLTLVFIPLMGVSRVYLGVHSPLDVIGGFAVGAMVVSGMRIFLAILQKYSSFKLQ